MTTLPREVARKQPANVSPRPRAVVARDDGRTIDGQWRATRGGMTGWNAFTALVVLLLAAGLAGLLLSLMQQS